MDEVAATIGTVPDAPLCPRCDGSMTRRVSSKTQAPFWGCDRWPQCDGLIDIQDEPPEQESETTMITLDLGWAWRRDTAKAVLLKIVENSERWHGDKRTAGQIAVQLTDELIDALGGRENGRSE